MSYDPRRHHRRSIRLRGYDYNRPGAYFVTVGVQNRACILGEVRRGRMRENAFAQIVRDVWGSLPARYPRVKTDAFVVMPNHVHGVVIITEAAPRAIPVGAIHESPLQELPPPDHLPTHKPPRQDQASKRRKMLLPLVMGYWKMNAAKQINLLRGTAGSRVWQRNYYEHIVRSPDDLDRIRAYVARNPARWADDRRNAV